MPAAKNSTPKQVAKKAKEMHTVKKTKPQKKKQFMPKRSSACKKKRNKKMPRIVVLSTNPDAMDNPALQHLLKVIRKFLKEDE